MRCLKLTVAYRGTQYCGWQVQNGQDSIQARLESAFKELTGEQVRIVASGRTDAGVHALGQVASVNIESSLECQKIRRGLNALTPEDISILDVAEVPNGFHAIRDAVRKRYRYLLQFGPVPNPLERSERWFLPYDLNVAAMRKGCDKMIGEHDFACFQAAGSDRKTTVREIYECELIDESTGWFRQLRFEIEGNGFLYNMVRNIVGTLVEIGRERKPAEWIDELILGRDRKLAGETAPAHGLCLLQVDYDLKPRT